MLILTRRAALLGIALTASFSTMAHAHSDEEHIIGLMKSMFDKPDNPLSVTPVVVRGDNAIASWSQGNMGGRALLWKKDGEWQIRLCSGAGLKDAKMLEGAGISAEDAKSMAEELLAGEAKLDQALVAKYDSFQGIVDMSGDAQAGGHAGHKHGSSTQSQ